MSKCCLSYGRNARRCCGHDHGSKAVQKPSLVDIEVVRKIFSQAMKNMHGRMLSCIQGELSREDLINKNQQLSQWLGETFCGHNRHFEEGSESWNPVGLAGVLRKMLIVKNIPYSQQADDESIVFIAASIFVEESQKIISDQLTQKDLLSENQMFNTKDKENFIEYWTLIFSGAPISILDF